MKKDKVKRSGRKKLYNEETTTRTYRMPVSKVAQVDELVRAQLKIYQATKQT